MSEKNCSNCGDRNCAGSKLGPCDSWQVGPNKKPIEYDISKAREAKPKWDKETIEELIGRMKLHRLDFAGKLSISGMNVPWFQIEQIANKMKKEVE